MKSIIPGGGLIRPALTLAERETPVPGKADVLVKVKAASVNPKDWKLNYQLGRLATPLGRRFLPAVFGDDLAGEVLAVGDAVEGFAVGDRVFGMDMRLRTASLAEYAVISQKRIAHMPQTASFAEAAAVPLAAQTALQGLRKGGAVEGSEVLIIGASGGVGTYTVQIAKAMGCHVTAVCSTGNLELVRELGADAVIDYTAGDYRQDAGPFDLVYDVTSYETPGSCRKLMKPDAWFISTMGNGRSIWATLLARKQNAALITVESYTNDLKTIATWMDAGKVKSIIDSQYAFAEAQQAYDRSRSGRARGKIVIRVAD